MAEGLLIKQEKYLETGIHIGTKLKTIDMQRFIYRTRSDGLFVLDLRKVDERIRLAGKVLSKADPATIVVIASRTYSTLAAKAFANLTGCKVVEGRFVPGMFTNVSREDFIEPKLVLICDPKGERQAVTECGKMGIATVGLCDTDNYTSFMDWVVPCNNKGRRSLSLIFWLFAREMAMGAKKISSYEEFSPTFEEFEASTNVEEEAKAPETIAPEQVEGVQEEKEEEAEGAEALNEEKEAKKPKEKPKAEKAKKPKDEGEKKHEKKEEKHDGHVHEKKEEAHGEKEHQEKRAEHETHAHKEHEKKEEAHAEHAHKEHEKKE